LVGVAVKVTDVPEQIVVADAEIATDGVTGALTVIVTVFELAVDGLAHERLEVIIHVIVLPLAKVPFVYVGLFVPTLLPFNCH
jgi:hypothetical protein